MQRPDESQPDAGVVQETAEEVEIPEPGFDVVVALDARRAKSGHSYAGNSATRRVTTTVVAGVTRYLTVHSSRLRGGVSHQTACR
jgi:hypothetical protein